MYYSCMHIAQHLCTVTVAPQPITLWSDAGLGSAEYTAHQLLRYVEESVIGVLSVGITPSSVIEHFTSALSSRQTELSAKVIVVVLWFVFARLHFVYCCSRSLVTVATNSGHHLGNRSSSPSRQTSSELIFKSVTVNSLVKLVCVQTCM